MYFLMVFGELYIRAQSRLRPTGRSLERTGSFLLLKYIKNETEEITIKSKKAIKIE
ncbi:hypothetical protein WR164_09480 [Philodulcilactobacillus myokoensis]|uniref:Uncharacterized protein n=1 Tax=Philodulcilactobacillus myokoensis TaxID=2929573 RepID=A0A9W6B0X3_9LACO|nr:hypothetical protein WR164_09480 [Philodulcilactobacillus myokoensis]